ncbi:transposase, partial [Campylobacter jejuni]|nr:transposase [Campylobacter jejuni]
MQITKGFKYRIYPNLEQQKLLNHQFFIYNQAYNIILDLQKKQMQINKNLDKSQRTYLTAVQLDNKVKEILRQRELAFKSVVTQQARINLLRALKDKTKGFPKF